MTKRLLIFGSHEIAILARFYFERDSEYDVVGFTVDDEFVDADQLQGLPLIPFSVIEREFPPQSTDMHVALSYQKLNRVRQEKYEQVRKLGYRLASYVCSKSATWPDLDIGDNCFILENQTIQPTVRIGNNVVIWSGNHIGHGTVVGHHTYISSHVCLSGHCSIGERCFLGVNSTVRDFVTIGDEVFVTMHAAVTANVDDGAIVIGASGETLAATDRRSRALKRKYFGL